MKSQDAAGARAALTEFLGRWSDDSDAWVQVARLDLQSRHYDTAEQAVLRALDSDAASLPALTVVFQLYRLRMQSTDALAHLEQLEAAGVSTAQRARLAEAAGQLPQAATLYREACEASRDDADAQFAYGQFLQKTGDLDLLRDGFLQGLLRVSQSPKLGAIEAQLRTLAAICQPEDVQFTPTLNSLVFKSVARIGAEVRARTPRRVAAFGERRIAIVIGSLGPGGAERQCATLSAALAERKGELGIASVRLFAFNLHQRPRDAFYLPRVKAAGVEVVEYFDRQTVLPSDTFAGLGAGGAEIGQLISLMQPSSRAQRYLQLMTHLRSYDPDVVYGWLDESIVQSGLSQAVLPHARMVGRWGSMPPGMNRDVTPQRRSEAEQVRSAYQSIRTHFPASTLLANSSETAATYARWLAWPEGSVGTINNGFDFSKMQPLPNARERIRRDLGIPADARVFGSVIRMSEEKRPFLWLDIASRISQRAKRPCHFILVGDGPLLDPVQAAAAQMSDVTVHVVGRKTDVPDWYRAMDAFLLTSSVEGMSNSLLEAQFFGLPVVCFNVGGLAEGVVDGKTGFLVTEGDVERYIGHATAIADDPDYADSLGQAGAQFVTTTFGLDSLVQNSMAAFGFAETPTAAVSTGLMTQDAPDTAQLINNALKRSA
jgi:glycosyltransferase involved in cell wall biosynthesis